MGWSSGLTPGINRCGEELSNSSALSLIPGAGIEQLCLGFWPKIRGVASRLEFPAHRHHTWSSRAPSSATSFVTGS